MRIAFLGTAEFSVPSLRACAAAGHEIVAVVTQPDRPGDRGRPAPRPVADVAEQLGLSLQRPERLRDPAAMVELLGTHPEALVVAAYGQILPAALLDAPRHGGINVHGSLLPRWRGAAPVPAAILAGDAQTGVGIMRMEAGLDTGPVYAAEATPIGHAEATPELLARLAVMGARLLVRVLAGLEEGTWPPPTPQDEALATHAPRLRREDGAVDWAERDAQQVDRMVRALQPWPGTTATVMGEPVRLLSGAPVAGDVRDDAAPGTVRPAPRGDVVIACRSGAYRIDILQPPGRRSMDAAAWLRGRRRGGEPRHDT